MKVLIEPLSIERTRNSSRSTSWTSRTATRNGRTKTYFLPPETQSLFHDVLVKFIDKNKEPTKTLPRDLQDGFINQLKNLLPLMEESESKKLCEKAKTNVFRHKDLLPKPLKLYILSLITALYYLSRLLLPAIALSSFRRMPESGVFRHALDKLYSIILCEVI